MRRISIICLLLPALLTACTESSQGPGDYYYSPDVPPGVNVYYYDWSDGIAPDTVYFQALVGEWNRVDTLFYMLAEGERVIVENWFIDKQRGAGRGLRPARGHRVRLACLDGRRHRRARLDSLSLPQPPEPLSRSDRRAPRRGPASETTG